MASVQVWQSELKDKQLPFICAMTGLPAETWRKFRFKTVPEWAKYSNGLAFSQFHILAPVIEEAAMRRAKGYLPLTRASQRRLQFLNLGLLGLTPAAVVFTLLAILIDSYNAANAPFGGVFVGLALLSLAVSVLGLLYVAPRVGPNGIVAPAPRGYRDYVVDLQRVHPAFVEAVRRYQEERARQSAVNHPSPIGTESK